MPKTIIVPEGDRLVFPDDMPDADIAHVIRTQYYGQHGEIAQQEIAADRNPPTVMERISDAAQSGLRAVGMFPDKNQIRQTRAARATIDKLAADRGETTQQFREKTLEGSNVSNPTAFAAMGALNMATGGISGKILEDVTPRADTVTDKTAEALGSVAGFAVPFGASMKVIGKVPALNRILATTEGATAAAKIINASKNVGKMTLGMGGASVLADAANIMDSPSYHQAKTKALEAAKSGAEMGVVFGVAGAIPGAFPGFKDFAADPFNAKKLATSILSAGIGNAAMDEITGNRIWDDRPIDKKVFDYGLNTYFLFFNPNGQVKKDVIQKLLKSGKTPQEYSAEVLMNGRPARKMEESGYNVITLPQRQLPAAPQRQLPAARAAASDVFFAGDRGIEPRGGQRLLTEGVPTGEEPFIQTPEGMRRATPAEAFNMRTEAQRRAELGITPDVEKAMRERGTSQPPPDRELYQFRPGKKDVAGERWAIVPLTEERFQKFVRPTLPPDYAGTLKEYRAKHPEAESVRLSQNSTATHDLPPRVTGIGKLEDLRPGKESGGYVLKVGSFKSPLALDYRRYGTPESHAEATGYVGEGVSLKFQKPKPEGQLEVMPADVLPDISSGKNVPHGTTELWQFRPNKEGGQVEGNRVEIHPLTEELFQKEVAPTLRKGYAESLAEYQSYHPEQTHIAYIRKAGMNIPITQSGPLAELRPNQEAIKRDWAMKVDHFDHPLAEDYRTVPDSENNTRTLSLMEREIAPFAKKPETGATIASIIRKTGVDSNDVLAQDARETLNRAGLNPNLVRRGGKPLDRILESINEMVPEGQRINTPSELLDRIANQPDAPLEDNADYPTWANRTSAREMKSLIDKAQNGHDMTERQAKLFESAFNRALLEQRAEIENMAIAEKQAETERRIEEMRAEPEEPSDASFEFGANKQSVAKHEPKPRQQEMLGSEDVGGKGSQRGIFDAPLSADAEKSANVKAELERRTGNAEIKAGTDIQNFGEKIGERLYSNPLDLVYEHTKLNYGKYLTAAALGNEWDDDGNWHWNPVKFSLAAAAFHGIGGTFGKINGHAPGVEAWKLIEKGADKLFRTPLLMPLHRTGGADPKAHEILQEAKLHSRRTQAELTQLARKVAKEFTVDERRQMSDWIEQEGDLSNISDRVKVQSENVKKWQQQIGKELVNSGMLNPETYAKNKDTYLHRIYEREMDGALAKHLRRFLSLKGNWSMMRGKYVDLPKSASRTDWKKDDIVYKMQLPGADGMATRYVHQSEATSYTNKGWWQMDNFKVRSIDAKGKIRIWRDWTREERTRMGEERDAALRFGIGSNAAMRDLFIGNAFKEIATNPKWASATPVEGWTHLPNATVGGGSGLKKYGALGGMYVDPGIANAVKAARLPWRNLENPGLKKAMDIYLGGLNVFKVGKTVLAPVAHFNNFISNITATVMAGQNPAEILYRGGKGLLKKSVYFKEAQDHGLIDNDLVVNETDLNSWLSTMERKGIIKNIAEGHPVEAFKTAVQYGSDLYQLGDSVYKLGLYSHLRDKGLNPVESTKEANKYYFDYSDLPVGAKAVRDFYIPFFSYTYKAIPMLAESAVKTPWRAIGVISALEAITAYSYASLYGPEGGARREEEERLRPEYAKGHTFFGQKELRLPTDSTNAAGEKIGKTLNISRIMPGGNVFDIRSFGDGTTGWPDILGGSPLGGNPYLQTLTGVTMTGKDYFNKPIMPYPKDGMDNPENVKSVVKFIAEQWLPNNPLVPGSYYYQMIGNALTAHGDIPPNMADKLGFTGTDRAGNQLDPLQAGTAAVGIKVHDVDTIKARQHHARDFASMEREAKDVLRNTIRSGNVSESQKTLAREQFRTQIERIRKQRAEMLR